jgi:DNA polymerase V
MKKDKRGGARPGAGRKPGRGAYGEETAVMRVPASKVSSVKDLLSRLYDTRRAEIPGGAMRFTITPTQIRTPLFANRIPAGFPSPADDHVEAELDFNELLIKNPPATFCVRVKGSSMTGAGIHDGDIIVVDRSIEANNGSFIVAEYDGGYTVKRLSVRRGKTRLLSENPDFQPIEFKEGQELRVFGVVTNVIHPVK